MLENDNTTTGPILINHFQVKDNAKNFSEDQSVSLRKFLVDYFYNCLNKFQDFMIDCLNDNNLTFESNSILRLKGKNLLLEEVTEKNQVQNFDIEYFVQKEKEISSLIKKYHKEKEIKNKESIKNQILQNKKNLLNQLYFQIMKNQISHIESLRNKDAPDSQKLVKAMEKKLGFTPTPNNFALKSSSKFERMCEVSRIISNIVLSEILLHMSQLNLIYMMVQKKDLKVEELSNIYNDFEKDFKNLAMSLQNKEVIKKFKEIIENAESDFGAGSSTYQVIEGMHRKVIEGFKKQFEQILKFRESIKKYSETYFKIEDANQKMQIQIELIKEFVEIKNSKEIKSIYIIYNKNQEFFNEFLKNSKIGSQKLGFDALLENENSQTFEEIYRREKQNFDKTYKKCFEILGSSIGQGKLGNLFKDLENIKNEFEKQVSLNVKKGNQEENQEKSNETQNSQDKQKTDLNKNNKPETENKGDKTEETSGNKTESKKIKQGLKLLNNSTELKIYQRKK